MKFARTPRGMQPLLMLYGYEIHARRLGTYSFMTTVMTFYDVRKRGGAFCDSFTLDNLDGPELVLWAIQAFEEHGMVDWTAAPYKHGDPRRGHLGVGF